MGNPPWKALDKVEGSIIEKLGGYYGKIYIHQLPLEKIGEFVKAVDEHRREDIERILEEIEKEKENISESF